jgi:XTP/dITP diphosphohydrolase
MSLPSGAWGAADAPRLLLATTSPHKSAELRALLAAVPFALTEPAALGLEGLEVDETGASFAENAAIKALAWARAAGTLALADDSGLEIDALDGAPGIYSARWAGPGVSYRERFRLLLARLDGLPPARRTARYRCALAVADAERVLVATEGTLEGRIAPAPRGSGGFGYDPIFEVPGTGRTLGEMSAAEKRGISHRARAAAAAVPALARLRRGDAAPPGGAG